jgi:SEC-C domain protein
VGSQIEDNEYFIMYPQDTLYFTIDDLIILFKQHFINFNKRTLYYYAQDKKKLNLIPMTQDIDIITYYLKNKQTFYQEGLFDSSMIYIEIGLGLYLRKYYMDEDLRYVYSPYYNKVIPIFHLSAGVPIYAPTVSGKEKQFIMIEIGNKKLYIHFSENPQQHYLEVAGSFALWMYAAWYKKEINILKKDTDIKLVLTNKNDIQKEDGYYIVFIDIDTLFKNTKYENIEKKLFLNFTHLLQSANVISISLTNNVVDEMFKESAGHFLMTNEDALIYSNNDIVNHQLNDRWIDIILEDISEYLNIKGKEKKLSIIESKEIIKSIINYLQQEVKALIVKFDTKEMLKSLIKIYYSTLYQSKIIRKGFNSINNAYRYIGTELDQQFGVNSENSTIGIITQGIIEFIILNNIDNQSSSSSLEDRDKLFALMYHIAKMGSYMDMFNNEIPNTELTILKNGRIVIPDIFFRINNEYFLTLRKREIADLKLLEKQHQLLPPFILDVSDKNFLQAFIKEYGISFDVYKSILSTCSDYSINKNTSLVELSKNKFDSILHKLNEVEKNAFYKSFVLKNDLNDKQKLPQSELFFQRFNRLPQIITRPWVLYNNTIFFSIEILHISVSLLGERISNGTLRAKSNEMKSFIGDINKKKGEYFTEQLYQYYIDLDDSSLIVKKEVLVKPNKLLSANTDLGDIDLLIINTKLKQIICIEIKDYYEARTVYDYISQNEKIKKSLPKVQKRDDWCKNNINKFKSYCESVDEDYRIRTFFITRNEPIYNYIPNENDSTIAIIPVFVLIKDPYYLFRD